MARLGEIFDLKVTKNSFSDCNLSGHNKLYNSSNDS